MAALPRNTLSQVGSGPFLQYVTSGLGWKWLQGTFTLFVLQFPFCFAEPQHNNLHLQTNYNTPLKPDGNWEGRI